MSIFHKDSEEIKFKFLSDSVLKAFEQDGRKYCRLTASSDGEDLVGDVMSQKAFEQMKSAAVGTVMFMNHSTNVPEDVFGTVAEATIEKKAVELVGGGSCESERRRSPSRTTENPRACPGVSTGLTAQFMIRVEREFQDRQQ
jgi:hypothetical protein